jgi:hypothetical protein
MWMYVFILIFMACDDPQIALMKDENDSLRQNLDNLRSQYDHVANRLRDIEEHFAFGRTTAETMVKPDDAEAKVFMDTLSISILTSNGDTLVFKNNLIEGGNARVYEYRGYYPNIGYHLIEITFYEGRGYLFVNQKNGRQYHLDGMPQFSPYTTTVPS